MSFREFYKMTYQRVLPWYIIKSKLQSDVPENSPLRIYVKIKIKRDVLANKNLNILKFMLKIRSGNILHFPEFYLLFTLLVIHKFIKE
jgi:hypothetical protein